MQRKTLLASALAMLIAGSASYVVAQDAAPSAPPAPAQKARPPAPPKGPSMGDNGPRGSRGGPDFDGPGFGGPGFGGPGSAVISDLHELERLYMMTGRAKELPALYNDVLAKSQDPVVRTYVYHHLARAQMAPSNPDQAIATLRKSLDENLANAAKQRAEFEKMRSEWQERHATAKPGPAPAPKP
ncbi:hypothetical protein ISN76_15915 [Dyella halodurans]|uniref:Uncharacterized protein n=1 Tax=Dyella halodurans TaxID=1920171 RepID=A0ABV9C6X8_9GAMM|nr:hypothetical protein [Dyella halodurans]